MSLLARRIGIVAALLVLLGGSIAFQVLSKLKETPIRVRGELARPEVEVLKVKNEQAFYPVQLQGQLVAYDKIDIFSEVTGTLKGSDRPFKEGNYFTKGQVLLRLDDEEARLNLLSQKSNFLNAVTAIMPDLKVDYPDNFENWQAYLSGFELEEPLASLPEPASEQEKLFIASRNLLNQYYSIKSAEARLDKFKVYAPFSGVVTEALVNPGAVVRAGQKVGALMNNSRYELQATVPLSELDNLDVGRSVTLQAVELGGEWQGRVKRISDQVDPQTQSVTVFVEVSGKGLREGMYLKGTADSRPITGVFELSEELLVNQKAVYMVRDTQLVLQEVELVKIKDTSAIVRGLTDGTLLLSRKMPAAYDGMKVRIKE